MLHSAFALLLLTTAVAVLMLIRRIKAARSGEVRLRQYKLMDGDMPDKVVQAGNNYRNLFEMPVLFYTAVVAFLALGEGSEPVALALAWGYVALRAVHSAIHLTYNHVGHRLGIFLLSNLVLLALWLRLIWLAA
ncbi:MAPEG family protein [Gallaecimonas sp. GXIMD4217]|uniref:MAPEG family protein n=1 Tax=Gallaecimonas sp. GXIMD4217 TaxID=3131927 RepID=UPI00311B262D